MTAIATQLWMDDVGFVVSVELVLVATIAVVGLIAGFTAIRDGVISELSDVAGSVQDLNQSYSFNGVVGPSASTAGSEFNDSTDGPLDLADDPSAAADNCITFDGLPSDETG